MHSLVLVLLRGREHQHFISKAMQFKMSLNLLSSVMIFFFYVTGYSYNYEVKDMTRK